MELYHYLAILLSEIPMCVYLLLIIILLIGLVLFVRNEGSIKGIRHTFSLLLIEYLFAIYGATVLFRTTTTDREYNFQPFWSYINDEVKSDVSLYSENLMNVVVFIPVGLLAGVAFLEMAWKKVLVIGLGLSVGIEVMQYVFKKGFSEVDDVMHNTLGCAIGYGLWLMIRRYVSK